MTLYGSNKYLVFSFAYALFIIYGSLVPLDYQPKPVDIAWHIFQQTPYLKLGATSRADWIANIILYIPLTFFLAASFIHEQISPFRLAITITLILFAGLGLAFTIEFFQLFFPPRTVSQNDLIAETLGCVIGLVLWFSYGKRITTLQNSIKIGGQKAFLASAIIYTTSYLLISFFPYDFVTSFQELHSKITSGKDAFFLSSKCTNLVRCTVKLLSETLLAIPLGMFFSFLLRWHPQRLFAVMLMGFILGIIIETIQLFLVSGIAQGISIFTRTIGVGLGERLYTIIKKRENFFQSIKIRKVIVFAFIPYVLMLAILNGWSFSAKPNFLDGIDKIASINWLPFYYHYYTSESVALMSLLSNIFMYTPVGIGFWLWNNFPQYKHNHSVKITAGLTAGTLAFFIEASKLFLTNKHPDPTNILISFVSATLAYSACGLIAQWFHQPEPTKESERNLSTNKTDLRQSTIQTTTSQYLKGNILNKIISALILIFLFWKVLNYPGKSLLLLTSLIVYSALLYKYKNVWLIVIPALIPLADFTPYTGQFFFPEINYFILLTFAANIALKRYAHPFYYFKTPIILLLLAFIVLYLLSLLKGLFPLPSVDDNAFSNYYSHYNSFRVGQGVLWAFLFLPFLSYQVQQSNRAKELFSYGILIGLTGVAVSAIWERFLFPGLFNYMSDYRITATFSSMHTGGGHIDTYIALSLPFIAILFKKTKHYLLGISLFLLSVYVLMVTFSRGLYIAFLTQIIVLTIFLIVSRQKHTSSIKHKTLLIPLFLITIAAIVFPVFEGSYIQERFSKINQDKQIRTNHWKDALQMMDQNFTTYALGMGIGTYPRTYFWNNSENTTPATYSIIQEKGNKILRLGSGDSLYMEQIIKILPNTQYHLSIIFRGNTPNSSITIPICEKSLLYSFRCQWITLHSKAGKNQWTNINRQIDLHSIGDNIGTTLGSLSKRPVKLILYNGNKNSIIDIKEIKLLDSNYNNIIHNGDFSNGIDHWFFSTDNHLPWHIKNLWVALIFDQGWLGAVIFFTLLLYALIHQFKLLQRHDFYAAILLTSIIGFLVVGTVVSPFDAPRISLLFFLIFFLALLDTNKTLEQQ